MRTGLARVAGVAAIVLVLAGLLKLTAPPQHATTADTANRGQRTGPGQTTPWGDPDLQGLWAATVTTPLQRPSRYANKEFFTEQERADLDRRRFGIVSKDRRGERGTEQDVGGAYSA